MTSTELLRRLVFAAALLGEATYLPAGARGNETALVLVRGEVVGQASSVGHFVRPELGAPRFGESLLVAAPLWQLPADLAAQVAA